MKHLGDITKINGSEIEPVHCIIGGSPCQDLSVAGKRAGLSGERSGLFVEQVRIVKEMREKYGTAYPRFMVWENVPGAFSSNKGADFAAVLTEIIRVVEPEAPSVAVPAKGWSTWGGFRDMDGRWSVAWRVHDAQYWGVPQRRRRIALVADFGGDTASEILFDRKSVSGDIAESGASGKRFAETAEAGASYAVRIRGGCDGGGKGALVQTEKSGTLGTGNDQTIFQPKAYGISAFESNAMRSANPHSGVYEADTSRTLDGTGGNPACNQGGIAVVQQKVKCLTPWDCQSKRIFDINGKSPTLQGGVGGGVNNPAIFADIPINDQTIFCLQGNGIDRADTAGCNGKGWREDACYTLNTVDRPAICAAFKLGNSETARSIGFAEEQAPTLNAECGGNKPAVLLDMAHANDVIRECGEIAPSLQARMGTGGNQIPLTYGIGNGQANEASIMTEEVSQTLNTMHDAQAILYQPKSAMEENWAESETKNALRAGESKVSHAVVCENVAHTLRAKAACAYREDAETYPVQNMMVRRLTPLECERLQGFPARKEIDIREMTKDEYIAWNLQCGNIVADSESGKVFATRGSGGVRLSKPKELLGSVVNGYKVVNIRNGTTKLQCRIHRIIWISVNGVVPDGYCIDHINNDKQDNRLSNLQLLTPTENSHKAKEDGLYKTGKDNKATKISPELHDEIAYLYATDDFTMRELAEVYGISKSRISQIVKETGWTDIGDYTDSTGKKRKTSDSARYKALGNSIALPFWQWMLRRMCEISGARTMGSLFDGIGGFPLCWERINGEGSCRWASEIEEFPIAVTKRHFKEE